ncbi:MAG TPA: DUF2497 domain-containing protein [Alphaproteobacteria bacterium]|nr:DUF2497 domain-containing protein [Alphaproteobacteria bacterium]
MSQNPSEQEPSIEEILASIRQIISDDDDEDTKESAKEKVVDDPIRHENNDVLELTENELVEDEPEEDEEDIEIEMIDRYADEDEDEPEEEPEEEDDPMARSILDEIRSAPKEPPPRPVPSEILSSGTQAAALSSITKLASKMPINNSRSYDGITLEDIVREMLHPMLREWMDDNLPPMVERIVQKELEKLARRAMDD